MVNFEYIKINGLPISQLSKEHIFNIIDNSIFEERKSSYIAITNTESMYYALRIREHREYIQGARFSLCDGIGIVLAALVQGKRVTRYHGPQFMLDACEYGVSRGWRHFLCGGVPGVADILTEKFGTMYPGIVISGTYCPPFREVTEDEELEMIEIINRSQSDFVWVGLGLLKQERWIDTYKDRLHVP